MAYQGNRGAGGQRRSNNYGGGQPAKAVVVEFRENERIHPELLDKKAMEQAQRFKPENPRRKNLSSSQLRKFFYEVKNLSLRHKSGRSWNELEPLFRMIKSKAYYSSKSNGASKIPDTFRAFITDNIDKVKNEKDFEAFVLYFEAVVGFAYGLDYVGK